MEKKIININEGFIMRFVCPLRDYEKISHTLVRVIDRGRFDYGDVTKETDSLTYAEGRPEVWFTVLCKNIKDAAFIKEVVHRIS